MEKEVIKSGDLVYIYLDEKRQFLTQIKPNSKLSTDFGEIGLDELIGKPFGFVGKTHLGKDFFCLYPTTGEVMLKVKRRTTIVYPKDLGYLLFETAIGPGSRVIEVGTGSGALTYFLSKTVSPSGVVYSYERNEEFLENAKENLRKLGRNNIEFFLRDVAEEGFLQEDVEAVFIDVPEPWTIIPHASKALRGGRHLVCWSPNIEQVKKTVDALKGQGFIKIKICEIMAREILMRERGTRPKEMGITHTAYLISATKFCKISDIAE